MVLLLYKFVEEIIIQNLDKKVYIIENNTLIYIKIARLYK